MADRALLVFPRPQTSQRGRLGGGGGKFRKPAPEEQRARLDAKFSQIARDLQGLQADVAGVDPEQVLILETVGQSVENVAKAAAKIPGLEWLSECELDEIEPAFGFQHDDDSERRLPVRLYALMSTQQSMDQLIALWTDWLENPRKRAARHFGPFKQLFMHLKDIRRWGPQDRVAETGILEQWRENIQIRGTQGNVRFEVELWFRREEARRAQAFNEVSQIINSVGGQCLHQATIGEIRYHGVLAEVSAAVAQEIVDQILRNEYSQLLRCEGVMFLRPLGQSRFALQPLEDRDSDIQRRLAGNDLPAGEPIVALLDGLPVENHFALAGRLVVDDPDDHRSRYTSGKQQHGTAMGSLIVHGDLNGDGPALRSPIYVRPLLVPHAMFDEEVSPDNQLLVDLVHRAVRRIMEGDGDTEPVAPSVLVVNFSIGDWDQPFAREPSPLARLLDWLAWKYRLLFVVSVGNYRDGILLPEGAEWQGFSDDEMVAATLRAMRRNQALRRPLSPAESINSLSVGVVHADECPSYEVGSRVDLLKGRRLPSPMNTVSSGFRRSTKPEVLLSGGRQLYEPPVGTGDEPLKFTPSISTNSPGQLSAAPGLGALELGRVKYCCGTSNAAALATRSAALINQMFDELEIPPDCQPLTREYKVVATKALIVHAASWGEAGEEIMRALSDGSEDWREVARLKQLFLGYGEVELARCLSSTDQRATVVGWGKLTTESGHIYQLPLPPSLSASKELRRLRATLAWVTPLNHAHKNYRKASLWIDVPEGGIGVERDGLDANAARRGTVEHRIFEGTDAKAFVDGAALEIKVNCKPDAGRLNEEIPYALAVTLEVGETVQFAIYDEIRTRLRAAVEVEART